ncbi:MAG: hypothetical protein ACLR9P_00285 [Escherichia coli]
MKTAATRCLFRRDFLLREEKARDAIQRAAGEPAGDAANLGDVFPRCTRNFTDSGNSSASAPLKISGTIAPVSNTFASRGEDKPGRDRPAARRTQRKAAVHGVNYHGAARWGQLEISVWR